jgi:type I restriction enzyme S subunit
MSWRTAKIGEICTIEKGAIGIQKAIPGEYPLVVTGAERKFHNEYQFDCEAVIIPLVSGTGHGHASIKRIHFQSGKFALGNILCAVIPKNPKQLNAEYLFRFLDLNKENELVARMKGMANVTLPIKEIAQIEIPLPSIKEQSEFVEKYKDLESKSNLLKEELTHQLTLVKKLRQQLLQDAVQGKLVEQNPEDEPASELLKKIKAGKAKLIAEKKIKKEKELPPIKPDEIPFEIPENWVWCRLGEICTKIGSGSTPKGSNYSHIGKPFFRSQNIYDNGIVYDDIKFISNEVHKQMNGTAVYANDILLNITGGSMGRCALVPEDVEEGNVSQHVCIIRPLLVDNDFYHSIILSPFFQRFIFSSTTGAGREGLPKYNLEQFIVPLPPLSEQNRIVQKLDELMQYCNELEASIKQSESQNEKLLQQVLREALRPVPLEAGEEPLEV